jgi:CubicO group peptidase (beta-lactamase class C family)
MSVNQQSNCRKVLSVLSFMLLFQLAHAQYDFSGIEKKLDAAKADIGKNYVCLIYKDGKIIYKKETEGFDAKAQASIGLASRWFVVALVMTFVDQGKINLDEKVSAYLPIFATYGKKFITVRNCLTEMTGIKSCNPTGKTLEEKVNAYASKCEINTNPGTAFDYDNIGITIAARLCEVIAKRGFEQIVNERIFRPLGMRNSSFFSESGSVNPANGAISAADDYITFLSLFLNKGVYKTKQVISEKSLAELATIQVTSNLVKQAPKTVSGYSYALGSWAAEGSDTKATTLTCPGFYGTYPWVDICRGYAAIIFTKTANGDNKKNTFTGIKQFIDGVIGDCN